MFQTLTNDVVNFEQLVPEISDRKIRGVHYLGSIQQMIYVMRIPAFCLCKNKGTGQLHGNHAADQRLCFHLIDSTIPLLFKSEVTSHLIIGLAKK